MTDLKPPIPNHTLPAEYHASEPRDHHLSGKANIALIDPLEDPRWDQFVENHPNGWICHLSGWKRLLESTFRHMRGYYFVLLDDRGKEVQAGLPVFHVKSWILGDRLVSIPFATLCDPLVSTAGQFSELFLAILGLARSLSVQRVEIRTFSAGHVIEDDRLSRSDTYRLHYLDLQNGSEALKKNFHPSCVARAIRRSLKSDLNLKAAETPSDLMQFYRLHRLTRKNAGLPLHPFRLFESLWGSFSSSGQVQIILAVKDNQAIGGVLSLKYKHRVSCDYVVFDQKHKQHRPNHFLYWNAIQSAASEGFSVFDFGRTASANLSLMKFKERWGAVSTGLTQFFYPPHTVYAASQNSGSMKQRLLSTVCKHAPDFAQETIGDFCYRHMG